MSKDGGPAFPRPMSHTGEVSAPVHVIQEQRGMTLRDYFAGQALAGMCANLHGEELAGHVAKAAYRIADAMLAEREKGGGDASGT